MFTKKIQEIYAKFLSPRTMTASQTRQQAMEEVILRNRKEVLRFRDVENNQDIVHLDRDFILSLRLLRYGADYTLDLGLERELNYHSNHASRELVCNGGKLIEGSPILLRQGIPFPLLNNLKQFGKTQKYTEDPTSKFSFRDIHSPTVAHIVHAGTVSTKAIAPWQELYAHLEMRTLVFYNFHAFSTRMLERFLLRDLRRELPTTHKNCFYGHYLLRSFMPTFDIRNFFLNYVLLLDHKGNVRWFSASKPSEGEKSVFFRHCSFLCEEYEKIRVPKGNQSSLKSGEKTGDSFIRKRNDP